MQRILAQSEKEFKEFFRDRLTLALAAAMPVVMVLLFGYTLALDPDNVRLLVEDLDRTPLSRQYVELYAGAADFRFVVSDVDQRADDALLSGAAEMALVVPAGFAREILAGRTAQVQVLIDGTDANSAVILKQTVAALHARFLQQTGVVPDPPVALETRYWYNPGLSDRQFFGTGSLGMVLIFFPALLGGVCTSREHEIGTVIQVYASTLSAFEWTLGKALPCIAIGMGELLLAYGAGALAFKYQPPADPTAFLTASLLYVAIGALFGMLIGSGARSQSATIQAVQLGVFLLSLLLSGFLAPLKNIPLWIRWISYFVPARYYIAVVRDALLRGGGWEASGRQVLVLAGLTCLVLAANVWLVRRMRFPD